ncbi:hypothetical protein AOR_1_184134 [Paecilomyces variotii No. 5]|uniref:Uncharacterized protein n=1 Tax=Byssochlamys spectabilis (strain No. 5 / NBRC 109023) TaxID=1356009 RepID=V5FPK7_BYSSN|nr:hypothetical protein AOR_1_184134 [Paecilomyces variotii No. 5]
MPSAADVSSSSTLGGTSPPPPPSIEADIISHLASTSALDELHASLLAALQRAGWTDRVRALSLELLRAGRCERFEDVVEAIVALAEGKSHPAVSPSSAQNGHRSSRNGNGTKKGNSDEEDADADADGEADADIDPDTLAFFENVDVRIPRGVVHQGVRAVKEALRDVVMIEGTEIDDDDYDSASEGEDIQNGNGNTRAKKKSPPIKKEKDGKETNGTADKAGKGPVKNGTPSPVKKTVKDKKAKAGKGVKS